MLNTRFRHTSRRGELIELVTALDLAFQRILHVAPRSSKFDFHFGYLPGKRCRQCSRFAFQFCRFAEKTSPHSTLRSPFANRHRLQ